MCSMSDGSLTCQQLWARFHPAVRGDEPQECLEKGICFPFGTMRCCWRTSGALWGVQFSVQVKGEESTPPHKSTF